MPRVARSRYDRGMMAEEKRFFLHVRRSANGLAWVHRLDRREENIALAMAQAHGIPDLVARVLAGRGVGIDEAVPFLDPTIRNLLPDPASLSDMEKAAERLVRAVSRRERVAIFGD
jgi:single-stranded-DNA-specific exonuclease